MGLILLVDDDDNIRTSFQKLLTEEGHRVEAVASGEAAVKAAEEVGPDLAIMDVRLPGISGIQAFERIRDRDPKLPVIIMTAYATTEAAIEATKLGAYDYVLKPFAIPEMLALIEQALEAGRLMKSRVSLDQAESDGPEDGPPGETIIGRSKPMQELYKAIGRAAPTEATVLIRGESGTGKELVARAIYSHSARADKPFIVINCVAIPESLLESELFGYEKGAFTGAQNRRIGKIEQARGGTVFLDEIGDMPLAIQAKLLRLLQEKSIERLGGHEQIEVDVRIIAATNRDLEQAIEGGRFRRDLFYRLSVVNISLPPLRERGEDIGLLADYFLRHFAARMGMPVPELTGQARQELLGRSWPGNVRQLANVLQEALIFSSGRPIEEASLGGDAEADPAPGGGPDQTPGRGGAGMERLVRGWLRTQLTSGRLTSPLSQVTDLVSSLLISEALMLTGGNRSRAAELLGVSRPTLIARIEKYGLKTSVSVAEGG